MEHLLTDGEVKKVAGNPFRIVDYSQLAEMTSADQLFARSPVVALLYLNEINGNNYSGHWTCLINRPDSIELFDSYGNAVDEFFDQKTRADRVATNSPKNYLAKLLLGSGKRIDYNEFKFQGSRCNINTCGRWCGLRARHRKLPLKDFQDVFRELKKRGRNLDEAVVELTRPIVGR